MAVNIFNTDSNTLLSGTSGRDTIKNGGFDANDIRYSGGSNVTINAGEGNDYIYNRGDTVTINAGAGNDEIENWGNEVTINAGAGNDSIKNWYNDKVTINAGAGNDEIDNDGDEVTINAGAGNDSVTNSSGSNVTIDAGAGNDYIYSYGSNVTIDAGDGNDSIFNNWNFSTNTAYDDSYGSDVVIKYSAGDGNDIIYGFKSNSTLSVGGGNYTTTKSGSDIVVTVGTGAVTLVGASNLSKVNIKGTKKTAESNSWKVSGTTATYGTSSKTLITVTGVKSGTSASNITLSGKTVTLKAAALNKNKVTISGDYKLALADDVTKSKSTNKNWSVSGSTAIYKSGGTTAGYKLAGDSKSISYQTASGSSALAKITGIKSKSGISESNKIITVKASSIADGKTVSVTGAGYKFKLNGTSGKNTLQGGAGNDTLTGNGGADLFIHTGGNDIITDYVEQDKIKISDYTSTISGDDIILTTSKGTLTIKNSADKTITINGETKNFSSGESLPTGLSYSDDGFALIAGKNFTAGAIDLNNYASVYDVDARKCKRINLDITGNNLNNSLVGGGGDDTLHGGAGSDTLKGGAGQDIFKYSAGNDIITDYRSSEDKIKLSNTEITNVKVGDDDIIFTTSEGTLKIVNGAGKSVTIIDKDDKEIEQRYSANIAEIIAEKSVGEFEFEDKIATQENLLTFTE